ncbi:MAG TPA: DUF2127 domain-containing protein [Candidatus Angelobacter sp.]|jgi:uncharacterized membrane protein (DUF2068 family)|nr:DUF2127 domain-containing protein [Candidatus Angelobacter sp.]
MDERKSILVKHLGLRGIAIFEAGKGLLALVAGFLLLTLRHKDYTHEALRLLRFLHINPGREVARGLLRFAGNMTDHKLWLFFLGVLIYVIVRFVEATGLWLEKEWAEWFALLSGSLYLPWEVLELARRATGVKWIIFAANLAIVLYLVWLRWTMHQERKRRDTDSPMEEPSPSI